jgi:hypothetical protein
MDSKEAKTPEEFFGDRMKDATIIEAGSVLVNVPSDDPIVATVLEEVKPLGGDLAAAQKLIGEKHPDLVVKWFGTTASFGQIVGVTLMRFEKGYAYFCPVCEKCSDIGILAIAGADGKIRLVKTVMGGDQSSNFEVRGDPTLADAMADLKSRLLRRKSDEIKRYRSDVKDLRENHAYNMAWLKEAITRSK